MEVIKVTKYIAYDGSVHDTHLKAKGHNENIANKSLDALFKELDSDRVNNNFYKMFTAAERHTVAAFIIDNANRFKLALEPITGKDKDLT